MRYLTGEEVSAATEASVSAKKQCHDFEMDLTVASIRRFTGGGAVDFGGSEEHPAETAAVLPVKREPQDRYGWWDLDAGSYLVSFNEIPRVTVAQIAFLQPHERLVLAGASHPSFHFRDTRDAIRTTLTVGTGGIRVKENARISKLLILDVG